MTTRRVAFHLAEQVAVILPALLNEDGTPVDLTAIGRLDLVTQRHDQTTRETTTLDSAPAPGLAAGTLTRYNARLGLVQLTIDDSYFTIGVPVYGTFFADGRDYPQVGYLLLIPQGIRP